MTPDLTRLVAPGEIERAVWSAMIWAASNNPAFNDLPEYTDGGSSFAETEARRAAARIIAALDPAELTAMLADARANALREAADVDWSHGRDVLDVAPEYLTPWQRGLVAGQTVMRAAILALIDKEPQT